MGPGADHPNRRPQGLHPGSATGRARAFLAGDMLPLFKRPALRWALAACVVGLLVAGPGRDERHSHFATTAVKSRMRRGTRTARELRTSDLKTVKQCLRSAGCARARHPSALRD